MVRKRSILKRALFPNRVDCLAIVVAILLGIGLTSAYSMRVFGSDIGNLIAMCFAAGVATCFIAIGSMVGLNRHSVERSGLLAIGCAVAIVATYIVGLFIKSSGFFPECLTYQRTEPPIVFYLENWSQVLLSFVGLIAIAFISCCLFATARSFPVWISKWKGSRFKADRKKILIGTAGVLLVIGVGNNVLNATMQGYDNKWITTILIGSILILAAPVCFLVVVYFPVHFFSGNAVLRRKALLAFALVVALFGYVVGMLYLFGAPAIEQQLAFFASLVCVCMFAMGLCAVREPRKDLELAGGSEERPSGSRSAPVDKSKLRPSLWTYLAVVLLALLVAFPFCFDTATLRTNGFAEANEVAKIRWSSKGQIIPSDRWAGSIWRCRFDDSSDPNVFESLGGVPKIYFQIEKSVKQVDFSKLPHSETPLGVAFDEGEVTTNQLQDLLQQQVATLIFNGCNVQGVSRIVEPVGLAELHFQSIQNRVTSVEKGLGAFKTFRNVGKLTIHNNIGPKDWPEIVRASQTTMVELHQLPDGLLTAQIRQAKANIVVWPPLLMMNGEMDERARRWITESDATLFLYLYLPVGLEKEYLTTLFDNMFTFPKRFKTVVAGEINWSSLELNGQFERRRFVFDSDDNGTITKMFLPFGEENPQVSTLTSLKVLSFDETWIQQKSEQTIYRGLADISALVNLEELYLSSTTDLESLNFLIGTKVLKHLQIPTVNRNGQTAIGFDTCPTLESITSLGLPDTLSLSEFTRLPKLKRLIVVDSFDEVCSDEALKTKYLAKLKKKFPSAEIQLVDEKGFSPELPQAFVEHRDRLAKQLSEELLRTDKPKE